MVEWIIAIFVLAIICLVVLSQYRRRRTEQKWRASLLSDRRKLSDEETVQEYQTAGGDAKTVHGILRVIGSTLHIEPGLLRSNDTLISLKAPGFAIWDDVVALDDRLTEAKLSEEDLARQTRTVFDVVKLIITAETRTGRVFG